MKFSSTLIFATLALAAPTPISIQNAALAARAVVVESPAHFVTSGGDELAQRDLTATATAAEIYRRDPEPSKFGRFLKGAFKKLGKFAISTLKSKFGGGGAAAAAGGGAAAAAGGAAAGGADAGGADAGGGEASE
ncbi:hypothetical protein GGTG_11139 [Gaeumannomyces tritici R3-111a-1]|uniref:Uncharacterized protein n=1 Tax=Gaeumannomyces tritici (strain R3-111a-1) TaxID=644352 RepID=J3PCB6_GAET3|nr:hypothetical protein GGTG_11139 [Gaeumannomyces tritici R3-111a-1]EJT71886.1 hypothetical protein GGTG_11139 [Gaeumannomyces tritici R3-111a-1]